MFEGFDNIALNDFLKLSSTNLRGHTLKIYKPQVTAYSRESHSVSGPSVSMLNYSSMVYMS